MTASRYPILPTLLLMMAGAFLAPPAHALQVDATVAADPSLGFCNNASSFTYDLEARPRKLIWVCEDTQPAVTKECYITNSVLYFDDSRYLIAICTTDIADAPLPPPDTDLLNDSFEGGLATAAKRLGKMSIESKVSLNLRLCLPPDEAGISRADLSALPVANQEYAAAHPEYHAKLDGVCAQVQEEAKKQAQAQAKSSPTPAPSAIRQGSVQ